MNASEATSKLSAAIRLRHMSLKTEEAYCGWLRRYVQHLATVPAALSSAQKMETFLTALARAGVSASTQNQAFNAVLFFYRAVVGQEPGKVNSLRARVPEQVRVAPEPDAVRALLAAVRDLHGYPTRLIVHLLYGCGLRVSEPLNLRIKDVRLRDSSLVIKSAKGAKDRIVPIPCSLVSEIQSQLLAARVVWERDQRARVPVKLPGLLDRKYPAHRFAWQWAWLFPSHAPCQDPRSGETVRWRCHEANVQRCVKAAAGPLGLDVTPHHLRHAYATHCLRRGANIRDLQDALGHAHLDTTARYITPRSCSVVSPLDS